MDRTTADKARLDSSGSESLLPESESPATDDGKTMPRTHTRRNKVKVLIAMFFAVILGALGDVSLSKGMKVVGNADYPSVPHAFLAAIENVYVVGGTLLLIGFLMLYLASLSWEDLSYVLPLTAADYVLVTILAFFLLHENVTPERWAGSVLVAAGIAFVARS